ncbi:hypothetical protein JWG40_10515 [Leptospira sp. 201903074]|uniref:hypothetical protein n=1 Tax=Leptospira abararensis TaxID=2810036 RepID=UPI0019625365|nr:hypothetical protein [Leptospira abararensis]MBM9547450.1 hypothetical protein [Leptospira abararensis]
MTNQRQFAFGTKINQYILNLHEDILLISAEELEIMLGFIVSSDNSEEAELATYIPNLEEKNILNGVSKVTYQEIKESTKYFDLIDDYFRSDTSGKLLKLYKAAKKILQTSYGSKFNRNLPGFLEAFVTKYKTNDPSISIEYIEKMLIFLHYMYSSCDLGEKP